MKSSFSKLLLAAAPLLLLVPARAAFNPGIVGADAQWVVYADLDGLRTSAFGSQIIAAATKNLAVQMPAGDIHLDVPKVLATIGSVTAYGTNLSHDPKSIDGALILQGTPDLRKIAEGLLAQATITTPDKVSEASGFPYPTYLSGNQVLVAFPPEPIIIISKSKPRLLDALAAFRGTTPSLAKAPSSPIGALLGNSAGAFLFAASVVPSDNFFPQGGPQARILQMAKSGSVGLGADGAQTFAHIALSADSDASADKLTKILQGMTALLSLGESNDKALSDFLNSAVVQRTDDTVTLRASPR